VILFKRNNTFGEDDCDGFAIAVAVNVSRLLQILREQESNFVTTPKTMNSFLSSNTRAYAE